MKLKNNALQELYETIVNGTFVLSMYAASPIDKAFRECDEKLSESATFEQIKNLQDCNDILEKSNGTLLKANMEAISKRRKLENEIEELHKHIDILSASEREALSAKKQLEKDLDDAKKQLKYFTQSRDDWRGRAKHAEKEAKKANEKIWALKDFNSEITSKNVDIANENVKLARKNELLEDKLSKLKSRLNSIPGYAAAFSQGQADLWDMLQNVNDSQPNDFDVECEGMEDVISMDLEDFLDIYRKWQEEKENDRLDNMRDYLARFCEGRVCEACPLGSNEYKCGCGYSFNKAADWDMKIIPDEELERYYEKARGCGKRAWHGDATAEKNKGTCILGMYDRSNSRDQ